MMLAQLMGQAQAALAVTLGLETSSARIEVQCLLQEVMQVQRVYLVSHPERVLSEAEYSHFQRLLQRRLAGEPVAYILGEREFFGLNFKVTPATLIPRPDTELLVELALQHIPQHVQCKVLDLGTGSGAIALAIAHNAHGVQVTACDASPAALAVARDNAAALKIANVKFVESDWYAKLGGSKFYIIVSNPPYIAADDVHLAQGDVRFEPSSALRSGVDGLDDIRRIVAQAPAHLAPGGWLLLEHGYDQAAAVRGLLEQTGFTAVFSARDLAGIERVSGGCSLS